MSQSHAIEKPTEDGILSADNSTTVALNAGETFTGAYVDCTHYGTVQILVKVTGTGATGNLYFHNSADTGTATRLGTTPYDPANGALIWSFTPRGKYFKISYTNGAVNQTTLVIQTMFFAGIKGHSFSPFLYTMSDATTGLVTRAVVAGKRIDGVYQNVPLDNAGQLRVSATPYTYGIAEGDIPAHYPFRKLGYSTTIGTGLVDLWEVATAAAYVFPTVGIQMRINSGGSASDAGVAGFTGTASGGSPTTLVDAAKDFTAGTPAVAGDIVLVQSGNRVQMGTIATGGVAATTLTVEGWTGGLLTPNGCTYSVIDKSAGGTGVQVVELHYLDNNYQEKETYIVLNGASAVNTTPTDILRVQHFHANVAGQTAAGGIPAANIVLTNTAGSVTYAMLSTGVNSSHQAIWTVPALTPEGVALSHAYITSWTISSAKATGTPVGTARLVATENDKEYNRGVIHAQDVVTVCNGALHQPFEVPLVFASKTDIKIRVISDAAGTTFTGRFEGWYE